MKKSYIIAIALAVFFIIWMLTGTFMGKPLESDESEKASVKKMTVQAQIQEASMVPLYLSAQSSVEPTRQIVLRTQTSGLVSSILVKEGEIVKKDDKSQLDNTSNQEPKNSQEG